MHTQKRLAFLDFLRGITLVSMIAYHAAWDYVYLYHHEIPGYRALPGYLWQQSICWTFIFLSGYCRGGSNREPHQLRSSRLRQIRRGLLLSACGLLITAVTSLLMPDSIVIMGVLSFYGLAVLLTALLQPLLSRIPAPVGLPLCFLFFFLTRDVSSGYLGFESLRLCALPRFLYQGFLPMVLGFPWPGFYSTDYFALLPWIFLYWCGYYASAFPKPALLQRSLCPPLEFAGRHSLLLYMLHQPVIMACMMLLPL